MGSLRVDYGETERVGNAICTYADDFKTLLNGINKLNEDLKSDWEGTDATSYTGKITEQAQLMDKLQKSIDEAGKLLKSAAKAYEEAMKQNTLN